MRTVRQRWEQLRAHWVEVVFYTSIVLFVGLLTGWLQVLLTWGLGAVLLLVFLVLLWTWLLIPALLGWRLAAAFWGWKPKQ